MPNRNQNGPGTAQAGFWNYAYSGTGRYKVAFFGQPEFNTWYMAENHDHALDCLAIDDRDVGCVRERMDGLAESGDIVITAPDGTVKVFEAMREAIYE